MSAHTIVAEFVLLQLFWFEHAGKLGRRDGAGSRRGSDATRLLTSIALPARALQAAGCSILRATSPYPRATDLEQKTQRESWRSTMVTRARARMERAQGHTRRNRRAMGGC